MRQILQPSFVADTLVHRKKYNVTREAGKKAREID